MRKVLLYIILLVSSLPCIGQVSDEIKQMAIQHAISDFSHSCNQLYSIDSVFCVTFNDSVFSEPTLIHIKENRYKYERGALIENIIFVGIITHPCQFLVAANTTPSNYKYPLPTRHVIIKGKLFYWHDKNYPLTQEMLEVLSRYHLLQDDEGGNIIIPDYLFDIGVEAAHYYYCNEDLSKHERVITSIAKDYYQPPLVDCD